MERPPSPPPGAFDEQYFKTYYRDYIAQNPPRRLRFYAQTIERHRRPDAPRRIHDIGCAFGRFLGSLDPAWQIFGTDVSEFAVARAAQENPRGAFKVAPAEARKVFDEPFGVVTAFDVIEHLPDPDAVARAVIEELVDGGCFVFVVPVYDGLSGPVIRLLDRDPTHLHKWPASAGSTGRSPTSRSWSGRGSSGISSRAATTCTSSPRHCAATRPRSSWSPGSADRAGDAIASSGAGPAPRPSPMPPAPAAARPAPSTPARAPRRRPCSAD